MLTNNEDGGFLAEFNGEEYLYRKDDPSGITPYNKIYESFLENITKTQIDTIIRKYFHKDRMCVCLISEKVPKQKKIAEECEKLTG